MPFSRAVRLTKRVRYDIVLKTAERKGERCGSTCRSRAGKRQKTALFPLRADDHIPDRQYALQYGGPCVHRPYAAGGDRRQACADGCRRVPADHHGHLGVCLAHGHRRRAARLHCRGRGREREIRAHYGQLPDDAARHGAGADGAVRGFCRAALAAVRRERKYDRLCARLYAYLRARHGFCAAHARHERLYHGAGLCHREHEDGAHRRAPQHRARPAVHFRARPRRARRGAGNGAVAGSVCG